MVQPIKVIGKYSQCLNVIESLRQFDGSKVAKKRLKINKCGKKDINKINKQLKQYLHWYNVTKVYKGLKYIMPMEFINKNLIN